MTLAENEAKVVRYWREVWTEGRFEIAAEIYAPAYRENLEPATPAEFIEGAAAWAAHFTGFRADIEELFSVGERVVSRVTYRGTHTGDFRRVPARGRSVEVPGIDIFEFEDGVVVQHWHSTDHLELFRQLGADIQPVDQDTEDRARPGATICRHDDHARGASAAADARDRAAAERRPRERPHR